MANEQNLRPKPFTSENQPPKEKKSRKGIPNRATVFKKFLSLKIGIPDPTGDDKEIKVSLYEAAALGQLSAAADGNTAAWKEIQDTLHGKQADKSEHNVLFDWVALSEAAKTGKNLTDDGADSNE